MKPIEYTVEELKNGQRLDTLVSDICPDLSRSAAARLIEQGEVLLSDKIVKKNATVATGDIVVIFQSI